MDFVELMDAIRATFEAHRDGHISTGERTPRRPQPVNVKPLSVGVTCAKCGTRAKRTITVDTNITIFEQAMLAIPCCEACGADDVALTIRVLDTV